MNPFITKHLILAQALRRTGAELILITYIGLNLNRPLYYVFAVSIDDDKLSDTIGHLRASSFPQ